MRILLTALTFGERPAKQSLDGSVSPTDGLGKWEILKLSWKSWISKQDLSVVLALGSGNTCCHSVQNTLSSRLLSKNLKIKIYRTIILPVVSYGCETWSLTLREELG
jgi:hypothetical protein